MDKIKDKLLAFQTVHVENLVRILTNNNTVIDMSDTGTGKTYTALATCYILKKRPIIVCPKSVMSSWKRVANMFGVKPLMIVNYETLKGFKYYNDTGDRIKCPYIEVNKHYIKFNKYNSDPTKKAARPVEYNEYSEYELDISEKDRKNVVFIFDEVHRATHLETQNGQLLFAAKITNLPLMILSATVADTPEKFKLFFWILNFIDPEVVNRQNMKYAQYMHTMIKWITRDHQPMVRIHNMIYPNRGTRMRIDSLGDLFPETQITAEPYSMGKTRELEIEKQYKIIAAELDNLQDKVKKDKANSLVKILRAHQKIELLKIPTFVELANDFMNSGYSVVIFINFTQTLETLAQMLRTHTLIYGHQTQQQRDDAINDFQENKSKIIICNLKAGGVGISLHDVYGGFPRASIISPPWSSIELKQSLGRIFRAGGRSKSIQRIVYAANTIEEKIAEKLREKLKNLNELNDGGVKDALSQFLKPKLPDRPLVD